MRQSHSDVPLHVMVALVADSESQETHLGMLSQKRVGIFTKEKAFVRFTSIMHDETASADSDSWTCDMFGTSRTIAFHVLPNHSLGKDLLIQLLPMLCQFSQPHSRYKDP
jgi:hypothetical protein